MCGDPPKANYRSFGEVCGRFAPGMAPTPFKIGSHFIIAAYAITNSRRYAFKQEIKLSNCQERVDEELLPRRLPIFAPSEKRNGHSRIGISKIYLHVAFRTPPLRLFGQKKRAAEEH